MALVGGPQVGQYRKCLSRKRWPAGLAMVLGGTCDREGKQVMTSRAQQAAAADAQTAYDIGVEGYTFLYPLVLMDLTRRQMTNVEAVGKVPGRGPANVFVNVPAFPPAGFRDVVRPNFDTLYSVAWLDLRNEPRIVSVPPAGENYYLLPMYDMWGEVFACPGTRTTGGDAGDFAVVGADWEGKVPEGLRRYDAPTPWVWVIGRTQASVATYDLVRTFQAGLKITSLSAWGGEPPTVKGYIDPGVDGTTPPPRQVAAFDAAAFFSYAAALLQQHAPRAMDYPVLDRLARIGFHAGDPFDLSTASPLVRKALAQAVPAAQQKISRHRAKLGRHVNGWGIATSNIGTYGTDYLTRACVGLIGLGANLAADAIYPVAYADADGQPLNGAHRYRWHLDDGGLPPVRAFWSLTLYDAEGFPVPNELDRFAIGDRDDLRFNADGSLDIHIQHERPDGGTSNWLPAPAGAFNLCARLYYPKPEVIDGTWVPAAVTRIS
jgi:hypothetical protein